MSFLDDRQARPVQLTSFEAMGLHLGEDDRSPLEVAVARHPTEPSKVTLRSTWKARQGGRATPVLLVVLYDDKAAICGPSGDDPPAYVGLDRGQVERICRQALDLPNRHAALKALAESLPAVTTRLSGVRNEGFLATHELEYGAPRRDDWDSATKKGGAILGRSGQSLLQGLGFEMEAHDNVTSILRATDRKVAVAVLLNASETPDLRGERFSNLSPVSYALAVADRESLPYVVIQQGSKVRVYPVDMGVGVGRRGRTETFVQCDADLLRDEDAGLIWLLCSADALVEHGSLSDLLEASSRFSGELAERLRERVYQSVVPTLAEGLVAARNLSKPTVQDLDETYEMAMTLLFRLLFIAYAEDKDLLPYKWNGLYQRRSLKTKAQEIFDLTQSAGEHDWGSGADHWAEATRLFRAVDQGNSDWGVPPYDGGLFSEEADVSRTGALLAEVSLPDSVMGPALRDLLLVEGPEGLGPVDFRSLGVREFGTVYEGLLESELSLAVADLAVDANDNYVPCPEGKTPSVAKGEIYLHNASGKRKSQGTYFTKSFAVEHLLDRALEPAIDEHLARLQELDDADAAGDFFDLRIVDIAMGSGHFLVAAIDRIERRLTSYLASRPLSGVTHELAGLRSAALNAMGDLAAQVEVEDTQLLRRLIARRCIYGVDINPVAVQLARLAVWIHTFVPGLPLSFLDHSLVAGNSLVGIGRMSEVDDAIRDGEKGLGLWAPGAEDLLQAAEEPLRRLANLADATPTDLATARKAHLAGREKLAPAEAFYDIVTASRISGQGLPVDPGDWATLRERIVGSPEQQKARRDIGELVPFHFPVAFPEVFLRARHGFDVIVGNPPWEEATVEEDAFWARHSPGLSALPQRLQEEEKASLRLARPDLIRLLENETKDAEALRAALKSGAYPGMGTGDPDLYKAFAWRFWDLATRDGRIGVVLPRSALAAKGSAEFRKKLFGEAQALDVTMILNNRQWFFEDVHPQYTIGLVAIRKGEPGGATDVEMRGPYNRLERYHEGVVKEPARFYGAEVQGWNDNASLPLLPTDESIEVFTVLRRAPRLDLNKRQSWRVRPHTELHATNDKKYMDVKSGSQPSGFWPVFKGASFDLWTPDTGEYYGYGDPEVLLPVLQAKRSRGARSRRSAFSEFDPDWISDADTLPCLKPRIAFRDITRATDTRTVRAALIPGNVFVTNKGPYLLWPRGSVREEAYLLGVLSSIPLDWYARRFVEISLNYHIFNPLPIPRPDEADRLFGHVVTLAGRLAARDDRYAQWASTVGVDVGPLPDDQAEDMMFQLDATVALLYGLSERHLEHVFATFHEGWDFETRLREVLRHYKALRK